MLLNQLIFGILSFEALICILLAIPFLNQFNLSVVRFFSSNVFTPETNLNYITHIIFALVGFIFLSNAQLNWKYRQSDEILSDGMRIRVLAAQRDMYISGSALFLFGLLRLVYSSMEKNLRMEKSLMALKKQAQGASEGFKQMMQEKEVVDKQLTKLKELVDQKDEGGEKQDILTKLLNENGSLQKEKESAEKTAKDQTSQLEMVKKQASSQSDAFMKLMDEKAAADDKIELVKKLQAELQAKNDECARLQEQTTSLKEQLQDFDFMFTDKKKKDD